MDSLGFFNKMYWFSVFVLHYEFIQVAIFCWFYRHYHVLSFLLCGMLWVIFWYWKIYVVECALIFCWVVCIIWFKLPSVFFFWSCLHDDWLAFWFVAIRTLATHVEIFFNLVDDFRHGDWQRHTLIGYYWRDPFLFGWMPLSI